MESRSFSWRVPLILLGVANVTLPLLAVIRYGFRRLETHGDGTEFVLAFGLVAFGGCAFLAALVQSVLGRRAFSAAVATIAQVAALYVLVQADAHLDACMVAEGQNPRMHWSLPW